MINKVKIMEAAIDTYLKNYDKYIGFWEDIDFKNFSEEEIWYYNSDYVRACKKKNRDIVKVSFVDIPIGEYDNMYDVSLDNVYFVKEIADKGYFDDMRKVINRKPLGYLTDDDMFGGYLERTIESFGVSLKDIEFDIIEDHPNYTVFRLDGIFEPSFESKVKGYNNTDDDKTKNDPREIKIIAKYHSELDLDKFSYIEMYIDIKFGDGYSYRAYKIFRYKGEHYLGIIEVHTCDNENIMLNNTNNRDIQYIKEMKSQIVDLTKMNSFFIINAVENKVAGSYQSGSDNPLLKNLEPDLYNCFGIPVLF